MTESTINIYQTDDGQTEINVKFDRAPSQKYISIWGARRTFNYRGILGSSTRGQKAGTEKNKIIQS